MRQLPSSGAHPSGDELMLRVESGGGLAGPIQPAVETPQVSVYADGRVILQGAQIAIYPSPSLPPLFVTRLSPSGLQAIVDAARDAGLANGDRHFDLPGIIDAHTTVFTFLDGGQRHVVSAYALGAEEEHEDAIPVAELEARRGMTAFQGALGDLPSWLGSEINARDLPFEFTELRIFVRAGPEEDPELPQPVAPWPLSGSLAEFGEPYPAGGEDVRCGTVSGGDLDELLPLVQRSNQLTPWESDGQLFGLGFRPLLPDEEACPAP